MNDFFKNLIELFDDIVGSCSPTVIWIFALILIACLLCSCEDEKPTEEGWYYYRESVQFNWQLVYVTMDINDQCLFTFNPYDVNQTNGLQWSRKVEREW